MKGLEGEAPIYQGTGKSCLFHKAGFIACEDVRRDAASWVSVDGDMVIINALFLLKAMVHKKITVEIY